MANNSNHYIYQALTGSSDLLKEVTHYRPISKIIFPKEIDYSRGSYIRYFFKRKNESIIYETSESEYNKVEEGLYLKVEFEWVISGDRWFAQRANEIKLSEAKKKIGESINNINSLQFFKP
jgi:hypothetical protein